MSPKRHKRRLLRLITKIKNEVCRLEEHGHIKYPYKDLHEVDLDISDLIHEIERTELA